MTTPARPRGRPKKNGSAPAGKSTMADVLRLGPAGLHQMFHGLQVPDPITFVVSPEYLNQTNIYPRQATLLKVVFLRDDLFTEYDLEVINDWTEKYKFTGNEGLPVDVLERIQILKSEGRKWFREVLWVMGRRAGKGYISGLCMAYVLWNFMAKGNPQNHYGISQDKQLTTLIFAGKLAQAKELLWKDFADVLSSSTCFKPYIHRRIEAEMSVYAPHDLVRKQDNPAVKPSFMIVPKEATPMAGRGPASMMLGFDEFAHVTKSVAKSEAGPVWDAATPSLDQFGLDAFISVPSSPWQMLGRFYELYEQAVEQVDGKPAYPSKLMVQLPSWGTYEDWERSPYLRLLPEDFEGDLGEYRNKPQPRFARHKKAIQEYDDNMRELERANPDQFKVERRSRFATALDAYLDSDKVEKIFEPWEERPERNGPKKLEMMERGKLVIDYSCHFDPAAVNDRFAVAVGHVEYVYTEGSKSGTPHVVFDLIKTYNPGDFEDHTIDYTYVVDDLWENIINKFYPTSMSHDQFSGPFLRQELQRRVRTNDLPKRVNIFEHTATRKSNWQLAETFKASINLGMVHAPEHDLAKQEMMFLLETVPGRVDHPDSGPVQSKDVFDAMSHVVYRLIGERVQDMMANLSSTHEPTMSGGIDALSRFNPDRQQQQHSPDSPQAKLAAFGRSAARGRFGAKGIMMRNGESW